MFICGVRYLARRLAEPPVAFDKLATVRTAFTAIFRAPPARRRSIYEVTWTRLLTPPTRPRLAAASTVLAAFMGGLAVGSALARPAQRVDAAGTGAARLRGLEISIGVLALALPFELRGARSPARQRLR